MSGISSSAADSIFTWSNIILIAGAALTVVGGIGVTWSGGIRDKFASERISSNEAIAAQANAEAAHARLEQERLKAEMAWRRVSPDQSARLAAALHGHDISLWLTFVGDDPEATVFREDLNGALTAAGVRTSFFSGYARAVGLTLKGGSPEQRQLILGAFQAAGIPLLASDQPSQFPNEPEVLVGTKPPPAFQ